MLRVEYVVNSREVEVRLLPETPMDVEVAKMLLKLDGSNLPLTTHALENGGLALRKVVGAEASTQQESEYFDKAKKA